jgi:predicted cobalt transporter CbtA
VYRPYGIMVFALHGKTIAGVVGFADASLFPEFGLPSELPG